MKSSPQSHENHPYTTPAEPVKTAAGSPCRAVFYRRYKSLRINYTGKELMLHKWGHHNKLCRATAPIVTH